MTLAQADGEMDEGGGARTQLDGAAQEGGDAAAAGGVDEALAAGHAAALGGDDVDHVHGPVADDRGGEGVVEVGHVLDDVDGGLLADPGEDGRGPVGVAVDALGMVVDHGPAHGVDGGLAGVDAGGGQLAQALHGLLLGPGAAGVAAQVDVGARHLAEPAHPLQVAAGIAPHLHLEGADPLLQLAAHLVGEGLQLRLHRHVVAHVRHPADLHPVVDPAAQQLVEGRPQPLAHQVEEGDLDAEEGESPKLGVAVRGQGRAHGGEGLPPTPEVPAHELGGEQLPQLVRRQRVHALGHVRDLPEADRSVIGEQLQDLVARAAVIGVGLQLVRVGGVGPVDPRDRHLAHAHVRDLQTAAPLSGLHAPEGKQR